MQASHRQGGVDRRDAWAEALAGRAGRWRVGVEEEGGVQDAYQVPSSDDSDFANRD